MHSYFCPECGATLDPGEKCTCPGFILRTWPNHKNEKAPSAATEEAKPIERLPNSKTSISQPKAKSNIKNYNEGYTSCRDESAEQITLIEWCEAMRGKYPELDLIHHIPNEGKRSPIAGANLVKMGLKKGVPDLFLPVARGKWHGLYIEMKAKDKTPTVAQNQWLCKLRVQGYRCVVAWSFEFARDFIEWYLNIKEEDDGLL